MLHWMYIHNNIWRVNYEERNECNENAFQLPQIDLSSSLALVIGWMTDTSDNAKWTCEHEISCDYGLPDLICFLGLLAASYILDSLDVL
jgi:hypothetical protein